jgi:hypothetical protein
MGPEKPYIRVCACLHLHGSSRCPNNKKISTILYICLYYTTIYNSLFFSLKINHMVKLQRHVFILELRMFMDN